MENGGRRMIYAHVCETMNLAKWDFRDAVETFGDEINKTSNYNHPIIFLKNGDEHHFMSWDHYDKWKLGRTYILLGETYHSGVKVGGKR